ncbi:MAG: MinD/ParA family protein [Gammaproteobacteria bacterium]|nr:MinD/ParA family protein [Gammaproteobacteria bacterium]
MLETLSYARQAEGLNSLLSPSASPVQVIAVASGKGGVGKTNLTANISVELSRMGNKVLILDADLGLANMDVLLGLNVKKNISHLISGEADINEIIVNGPEGVKIIPGSSGLYRMADLSHAEHIGLVRAFSTIAVNPDYLVIDSAAGISDSVITFTRAAHEIIVVVCDEPASITDAYALIKVLNKNHGINKFRVVANMVNNYQDGVNLYGKLLKVSERFLDVTLDYLGAVPYDEYLKKSVQKQGLVVMQYPRSKASLAIKKIAAKIEKMPLPDRARGHIEFFVERMFNI